jgi:hypothetical protein
LFLTTESTINTAACVHIQTKPTRTWRRAGLRLDALVGSALSVLWTKLATYNKSHYHSFFSAQLWNGYY